MCYACSFPVCFCLVFGQVSFFLFSGSVNLAGPRAVQIRGRVVTVSDLKEVLRARTEEKDRQRGSKERSYHGESYCYSWECPVQQQSTQMLQRKQTLRLDFLFRI